MDTPKTSQAKSGVNTKQKKLFAAVKKNDIQTTTQLIESGVEINFACPLQRGYVQMTPLMVAFQNAITEMVVLLLKAGAQVEMVVED